MKDITVIIPIHKYDDEVKAYLDKAVASVCACRKHYKGGKLNLFFVIANGIDPTQVAVDPDGQYAGYIVNDGPTDFCSQVNFAVEHIDTEYFSVLEYDDEYYPKWFKFVDEYSVGNESVGMFLPLAIMTSPEDTDYQYANEIALSNGFSQEFGMIDKQGLDTWNSFIVSGAVINTEDFKGVGMYKPSIILAYNYELMLRFANMQVKMMVVPKEGYKHVVGRKGSMTSNWIDTIPQEDVEAWFKLAKREFQYLKDRKKGIKNKEKETLK